MGILILRWLLSRTVRQAVDMCRQVRKLINAQRDLLTPEDIQELSKAVRALKGAIASGEKPGGLQTRMENIETVANGVLRPYPNASVRENVEVFLATGAVVLALRTFFFQPMAIPSGSAQPTLWGITFENLKGRNVEIPRGLSRIFQTCWSGVHYYHLVSKNEGELRVDSPKRILPFVKRQTLWVGDTPYHIWFPPDDCVEHADRHSGQTIHAGEDIVKLKVVSGDHLFVNRLTYNFRHPHRGEIIVFESTGIPGIIQNTHYIKRLIALGDEHVRIGDDRHVIINGRRLDASTPGFENVYGFDPREPPVPDHYSGHVNGTIAARYTESGLASRFADEKTEMVVPHGYYLAFGDNTMNSNDGRNWGPFPQEKVIGKASFVFWPIGARDNSPSRFGWGYR
jgi:signal peptidase I